MIPTLQLASAAWRRITRPRPAVVEPEPAAVVVEPLAAPTPFFVVTADRLPAPLSIRPGYTMCACGEPAWNRYVHYCRSAA